MRLSQYKQLFGLKAPCGQLLPRRLSWNGTQSLPGLRDGHWHRLTCLSHGSGCPEHPKDAHRAHSTPTSKQHHSAPNLVKNVGWKEVRKRWHWGQVKCMLSRSVVSDSSVSPWTVACQAPLSRGFPRQEYCNELPFPSPGDLPDTGTEPASPA